MLQLVKQVQAQTLGKIGEGTSLIQNSEIYDSGEIQWGALLQRGVTIFFFIAAIACFVYLLWGGYLYITSSGEPSKTAQARDKIIYAAIGLLVVAAAFAIWRLVLNVVGINPDAINTGF